MSKVVVVYGGGFQPMHRGHLSSYVQAKKVFPQADFYVAASNDTKVRPIPFEDKKFLAQQAGVVDPFVQVVAPINPKEILAKYNPETDIFILVRSERDPMGYTKKDGTPGYFQPFQSLDKCEPFSKHGYVLVTKKHDFDLNGQTIYSGTQVRNMYMNADDNGRVAIIKQLYPRGKEQKKIKQMLDHYLGPSESIKEYISRIKPLLKESNTQDKISMLRQLKEMMKQRVPEGNEMPVTLERWKQAITKRYPNAIFSTEAKFKGSTIAVIDHSGDSRGRKVGYYAPSTGRFKVGPEMNSKGIPAPQLWSRAPDPQSKQNVPESKIYSDETPKLTGLSFIELDILSESAGANYHKFNQALLKNLKLPNWTNTVEMYGVYVRKLDEAKVGKILLEEHQSDIEQTLFNELAQRSEGSIKSAKTGDKVSLLHLITLNIPGHKIVAKLNGFLNPKEIVKITNTGLFQQLEFADGSKYPDKDGGDIFQQTQGWNMTKLFPTYESASKAYTLYALVGKKMNKELEFDINIDQSITEYAPPTSADNEPDEEEIIRKLAAAWWNGPDDQMLNIEHTLAAMGWEIGQDESGDDDAGVFLIRTGDVNGDTYMAFNRSDLTEDSNVSENQDYLEEK